MTRTYRISPLGSAFIRMWRAWRILVPVLSVDVVIQAVTVWPPFTYDSDAWTVVSALISGVALWLSFGFICASALEVSDGSVRWASVLHRMRASALAFFVWSLVWGVAVAVGLALFVIPGVAVIALTPFLALAVLDGKPSPLMVNFRIIGGRFWSWLITTVLVLLVLIVCWYASGFAGFFLRPPLAAVPVWLVGGWLVAWFTTAFALLYRSVEAPRTSTPIQA